VRTHVAVADFSYNKENPEHEDSAAVASVVEGSQAADRGKAETRSLFLGRSTVVNRSACVRASCVPESSLVQRTPRATVAEEKCIQASEDQNAEVSKVSRGRTCGRKAFGR